MAKQKQEQSRRGRRAGRKLTLVNFDDIESTSKSKRPRQRSLSTERNRAVDTEEQVACDRGVVRRRVRKRSAQSRLA